MASTIDQMGTRGFTATRPDNKAIFVRAQRHSRLVRMLRVAVPAVAGICLLGITLFSWFDPMRVIGRLPTASGSLVISGTKITMEAPKLAGFTKDARAYELNARSAWQDITKPDVVEMEDIRAKLEASDKSPINLTAVNGLYERKSGTLKLSKDVFLTTSAYEVALQEAVVETQSNNVTSDKPVQVKMLQGVLNAKRLEVANGGDVVRFLGDVKMTINAAPAPAAAAASDKK